MRRGNAASDGAWAEGFGSCEGADYVSPSFEAARDIGATLRFLSGNHTLDLSHVVLGGFSAGGFASLAAANELGVVGVVVFAGGRGSMAADHGASRSNCSPSALVAATRRFGALMNARGPTLWLYSQNDHYFPPSLARSMFDAFVESAGLGRFVALPVFEHEGHGVGWKPEGVAVWAPFLGPMLDSLVKPHGPVAGSPP